MARTSLNLLRSGDQSEGRAEVAPAEGENFRLLVGLCSRCERRVANQPFEAMRQRIQHAAAILRRSDDEYRDLASEYHSGTLGEQIHGAGNLSVAFILFYGDGTALAIWRQGWQTADELVYQAIELTCRGPFDLDHIVIIVDNIERLNQQILAKLTTLKTSIRA
jgi:hypothetical protein